VAAPMPQGRLQPAQAVGKSFWPTARKEPAGAGWATPQPGRARILADIMVLSVEPGRRVPVP
jgi:hypothetical protein